MKVCPECRAEIDPNAKRCRYCRARLSRFSVPQLIGGVIAATICVFACSHIADGSNKPLAPAENNSPANEMADGSKGDAQGIDSDDDYIAQAEVALKNQARDPDSVAFLGEHVVHHADGSINVCGKYNGNNAFGGKAGFTDFVWGTPKSHIAGLTIYDPSSGNLGRTLNAWGEGCLPIGKGDSNDASSKQAAHKSAMIEKLKSQFFDEMMECQSDEHQSGDEVCNSQTTTLNKLKKFDICWDYSDWRVTRSDYGWHDCKISAPPGYSFDPALGNKEDGPVVD